MHHLIKQRLLSSPSKLKPKPKDIIKDLRGCAATRHLLTEQMVASALNFIKKQKAANVAKVVGKGKTCTVGGINEFIKQRLRANIQEETFTEHTCYIFGEPSVICAADGSGVETVRVCMTTENLLLNAYRQAQSGMQGLLCADTTHRLTTEGYPVFPIGTVDLGQHFHIIAYMVASNERSVDYTYCIQETKKELERVVKLYATERWSA